MQLVKANCMAWNYPLCSEQGKLYRFILISQCPNHAVSAPKEYPIAPKNNPLPILNSTGPKENRNAPKENVPVDYIYII